MNNLIDFTGKKIIVTGASSGIGKQMAITLSNLGGTVVIIARREDALNCTRRNMEGDNHIIVPFDLKNTSEIDLIVSRIVETIGKIDGLFYAAGIGDSHPVNMLSTDIIRNAFEVNYFPFIELVRCISKKKNHNKGMRIVGVSSVSAKCGDAGLTCYSSSKAALECSIRCLSRELYQKGIVLNALAPAMTNTVMYSDFVERYGANSESEKKLLERQYLGIADTEDIVNCGLFLLSDISKYISGVTFYADGGYTSVQ